MSTLTFRPLLLEDLEMLHAWLNEGPVLQWYSKKSLTLEEVKQKYGPEIEDTAKTRHFIVLSVGQPMGYVQTYRVADYPEWNHFVQAGNDAAGIDFLIGSSTFRGRGLGSEMIREFLSKIVFKDPTIATVVSGPDPLNVASQKTLEKAGFSYWKIIHNSDGDEYLMRIERGLRS